MKKRVICAAAAVLLTGLSSTVFVSAQPTNLNRGSGTVSVRVVQLEPAPSDLSSGAPSAMPAVKFPSA